MKGHLSQALDVAKARLRFESHREELLWELLWDRPVRAAMVLLGLAVFVALLASVFLLFQRDAVAVGVVGEAGASTPVPGFSSNPCVLNRPLRQGEVRLVPYPDLTAATKAWRMGEVTAILSVDGPDLNWYADDTDPGIWRIGDCVRHILMARDFAQAGLSPEVSAIAAYGIEAPEITQGPEPQATDPMDEVIEAILEVASEPTLAGDRPVMLALNESQIIWGLVFLMASFSSATFWTLSIRRDFEDGSVDIVATSAPIPSVLAGTALTQLGLRGLAWGVAWRPWTPFAVGAGLLASLWAARSLGTPDPVYVTRLGFGWLLLLSAWLLFGMLAAAFASLGDPQRRTGGAMFKLVALAMVPVFLGATAPSVPLLMLAPFPPFTPSIALLHLHTAPIAALLGAVIWTLTGAAGSAWMAIRFYRLGIETHGTASLTQLLGSLRVEP